MAHFPSNTLPAEFEQDHGSIDLADEKPSVGAGPRGTDDGGEDEELDLGDVGGRVWLVKVRSEHVGEVDVYCGWGLRAGCVRIVGRRGLGLSAGASRYTAWALSMRSGRCLNCLSVLGVAKAVAQRPVARLGGDI